MSSLLLGVGFPGGAVGVVGFAPDEVLELVEVGLGCVDLRLHGGEAGVDICL